MTSPPAGPITRRLNVILLVVSAVALVLAVVSGVRSQQYAQCQAQVSQVLVEKIRILTEVGARERVAERRRDDALDATLLDPAVGKPPSELTPGDRKRTLRLFVEYQAAARALRPERVAADKARADNPMPASPSEACA